jgi:hypothetical protein
MVRLYLAHPIAQNLAPDPLWMGESLLDLLIVLD